MTTNTANQVITEEEKDNSNALIKANLPSLKFKKNITLLVLTCFGVLGLSYMLEFDWVLIFTDGHYLVELLAEMFPPDFNILWEKPDILFSIFETLGMAFLGSLIGGLIALILSFFAASNTSPHPVLRLLVRGFFSIERAVPGLVMILIFIIVVGLGPFAGVLALTATTIGMFGKLFSDTIEEVNKDPINALYAIGGTKLQVLRFGIIPQVLPSITANLFYAFDVNLRAAIGLGIFGAGGIGFEIHMAMKMLLYKDALALIILTIVFITGLEKVSDFLRSRLLAEDTLK